MGFKYNYIFFNAEGQNKRSKNPDDYYSICTADLERMDNVRVVSYPLDYAPYYIRVIFNLHHMRRINQYIRLPFKNLWYPFYFKEDFHDKKPLCFVISGRYLSIDYIYYLKANYPDAKFVIIHRDLMEVTFRSWPECTEEMMRELFDLRMTFDEKEAEKYHILYFSEFESKIDVPIASDYPLSDVFFAGKAKGRLDKLLCLYDVFSKAGLKCDFYITETPKDRQKPLSGVEYAERQMTYSDMLYRTVNSNCVLEINQAGAVGYTSRFLEAVMFNKKLLTDNLSIKNSKFYRQDYIQCFSEVDSLDVNFIIRDVGKVDYNYVGEFSPMHLIEQIDKELKALDEGKGKREL